MDGIKTPSMVWSGDLPQELMAFKQYVTFIFKGPLSKLKMSIARTYEALQQELKEFKDGSNTHIDHVSNILSDNKPKTAYRKTNNRLDKSHNDKITNTNYHVTCKYCGLKHTGTQCPAAQSECRFCHKIGHWAAVCRQKSKPLSAQYHNKTDHA